MPTTAKLLTLEMGFSAGICREIVWDSAFFACEDVLD
jgi:hypothetical protein